MSQQNHPILSIVTVSFNGAALVDETMQKVATQTFKNFEVVVVDGASKDDTVTKFKQYTNLIGTLISEPDKSLYDAMNKGVKAAKGEWICFMNLGDAFYNENALEEIFSKHDVSEYDVVYANAITKNDPTGVHKVMGKQTDLSSYYFGIPLCHQAIFAKKATFEKIGDFDWHNFPLIADFEWQCRFFKQKGMTSLYIPTTVAVYEVIGFSFLNRKKSLKEHMRNAKFHYPTHIYIIWLLRYPLMIIKVELLSLLRNTPILTLWRKMVIRRKA